MGVPENLAQIRAALAAACSRVGRKPEDVQLMAVSKTHPVAAIREAYAAGQRLFGENRVQEVQGKAGELAAMPELQMHLIGPLQNNKTTKAAELFGAVDTVDSVKTAARLNEAAAALQRVLPVLVEVKLSPEPTKHGVAPEALRPLLEAIAGLPQLHLAGLMTVPPMGDDAQSARPYFRQLRELRDGLRKDFPSLAELSMGMSNDFEVAIEEGSTTIRIGTAVFGKRETP